MTQIGSMSASLTLESASFFNGLKRAADETSRTSKIIANNIGSITTAVQGLGVVMAVSMFAQRTKEALDYADAIADMADRTGASTKFIQEFGYAAQLAGSDVETARTGVEKFAKTVGDAANGNEAARQKLHEYGITALDVDTAVKQASETISKMDNPTKQLSATMDLFGKKAGTLTQTLAGGTKGLELQARAAKDLGIVLSDDLVRNAGQANDKLDTMKMIADARMAAMISKNAESIVSLGNAITDIKGALIGFWGQNPAGALAILGGLAGAAAGFKLGGGYGALIGGALAGAIGGEALHLSQREKSQDLGTRTEILRGETNRLKRLRERGAPQWQIDKQLERVNSERAKMDGAIKLHNSSQNQQPKPTEGSIPLPKPTASKSSGPSAAELALKEAERVARYVADTLKGQMDIVRSGGIYDSAGDLDYYKKMVVLAANERKNIKDGDDITVSGVRLDAASRRNQEAMLGGDEDILYANIRREIQSKYEEQLAQLDLSVKKGDIKGGIEEDTLRAQYLYQKLLDDNAADWEHRVTVDRQLAQSELVELGIKKDTLALQGDMARTASERRAVALQILKLELEERDKALAARQIGLDPNTAEYRDLQKQRDANTANGSLLQGQIMRSTMGPMESFLDGIPRSAADANEALQNIAVNGLTALNDGIVDALMNWANFGDTFENVAKEVVKALLSMAVQMTIIQPIANVLGGALGVHSLPAKANGGLSSGGLTLVGEHGAELVDLPGGSNVIPHHALNSVSGRSGGTVINVDARGSTDEALVQTMVIQGIQQAMPQITAKSTQSTMRALGRRQL